MKPSLSLVMTGRNDGYMGDFNWRISTALNVNARSAARIGRLRELEMLVVDWNSETPLRCVLELVPEAKECTRFVEVGPALAARWDVGFPDSVTTNIGLRRATGTYVAYSAADVAIPVSSMNALFAVLDGRTFNGDPSRVLWLGGRRHLAVSLVQRQPPLPMLEWLLQTGHGTYEENGLALNARGQPGHGAPANVILMHRDRWSECQGYDEEMVFVSFNDIDISLRVMQKYAPLHLDNFGVYSYHLEHFARPREYTDAGMIRDSGRKLNRCDQLDRAFAVSGETWGLANETIPLRSAA